MVERRSPKPKVAGSIPSTPATNLKWLIMTKEKTVKKTSPAQFVQQVRLETKKVTWPTRQETTVTSIMVLIIAVLAAIFFLIADGVISSLMKPILG